MIFFSRMGWLVPAIWIAVLSGAGAVPPDMLASYGIQNKAMFVFLAGAIVSAPLMWLIGGMLNKQKQEYLVKRFGKERVVRMGPHTFYFLPIEYYALIIPAATLFGYVLNLVW